MCCYLSDLSLSSVPSSGRCVASFLFIFMDSSCFSRTRILIPHLKPYTPKPPCLPIPHMALFPLVGARTCRVALNLIKHAMKTIHCLGSMLSDNQHMESSSSSTRHHSNDTLSLFHFSSPSPRAHSTEHSRRNLFFPYPRAHSTAYHDGSRFAQPTHGRLRPRGRSAEMPFPMYAGVCCGCFGCLSGG